jgi:chaperonin GroES
VQVGDKVIYSKYAGTEVKYEEEEYIIVGQNDIIAVVE